MKRKITLNTIVSTTNVSRNVHKIVPATDIQIITKRKLTPITALFYHIKDSRKHNTFKENNEFRETNRKSNNIQVKVIQCKPQPSSITSKQKTNTVIHKSFIFNKSQQCIQFKELNEMNQPFH